MGGVLGLYVRDSFSKRKFSLWNRHLHWPGRVSMDEMQCHGQIHRLSSDVQ